MLLPENFLITNSSGQLIAKLNVNLENGIIVSLEISEPTSEDMCTIAEDMGKLKELIKKGIFNGVLS
jgi:hypothetical protein